MIFSLFPRGPSFPTKDPLLTAARPGLTFPLTTRIQRENRREKKIFPRMPGGCSKDFLNGEDLSFGMLKIPENQFPSHA
jgi:hypothetical protein